MKKLTEKQKKYMDAFVEILLNSDINNYAEENVIMGRIKTGEKIPVEQYVRDLGYGDCNFNNVRLDLEGEVIDADGYIRNKDIDGYRRRFLYFAMSCIFDEVRITDDFDDDGMMNLRDDIRKYIENLFPLFNEVLNTYVDYDAFDCISAYTFSEIFNSNSKVAKLLVDIKLKALKNGENVSRYLKGAKVMPYFVLRLIKQDKSKYILQNNDTESVDYKLALFSVMDFYNTENTKILELKIKRWLELHTANSNGSGEGE